jgi:gamma-glutamylcyclotransferase (GGCT)/AIG2-like uncharacterized protein YtfP
MTVAMNPHLFVYGSLLSAVGHPTGQRLRSEARLVGAASIPGRLYRVSWYPGLAQAEADSARVHGEVYTLVDPAPTLAWLDDYESIVPGSDADNEYVRVERPVQLASGRDILAWVYLYQRDVAGLELVADGRWVGTAPDPGHLPRE